MQPIHFPDLLRCRVPRGFPDAVKRAAHQKRTTAPEWVRQAIRQALEDQGVGLPEIDERQGA